MRALMKQRVWNCLRRASHHWCSQSRSDGSLEVDWDVELLRRDVCVGDVFAESWSVGPCSPISAPFRPWCLYIADAQFRLSTVTLSRSVRLRVSIAQHIGNNQLQNNARTKPRHFAIVPRLMPFFLPISEALNWRCKSEK